MTKKNILKIAAVVGATAFIVIPFLAGALGTSKITICHATGSTIKPYVEITVSQSALNGHERHANDIIPAPAGGCPSSNSTQPTLNFTAESTVVLAGSPDILSWTSTNTVSCTAASDNDSANWSGAEPTSGIATVFPQGPATIYSISCLGADSSTVSGSVTISVISPQ